jgi:hypothetical protein
MITLHRFTHHVALWAVLGSALATTDGHRRVHARLAPDVLDPARIPARHREGAAILAGRHLPRHVVGI